MRRAEEVTAKLESLRVWLDDNDLDAVLLSSQSGFAWVTAGGHSHVTVGDEAGAASALVTGDNAYLLTSNIERDRLLDEELDGLPFTPVDWPWHEPGAEDQAVTRLCDPARTVSDLGRLGLPIAPPDLIELRFTLLAPEIDRYRRLGADAAEAVEIACQSARRGDSEHDVAARLTFECERRAILPLVNLVGADNRISLYRHPLPTAARAEHTLMVVLSGRRHGLHASLTRMVSWARGDTDLAARHRAVTRIDTRMILASRPGSSLGEVLNDGLDQYAAEGFGQEWQLHHQGGLTGYAPRELIATPKAGHRLAAGQVVAWNPSITRVKSEDTVLVGADGPVVLTRTGRWPHDEVSVDEGTLHRPSILDR